MLGQNMFPKQDNASAQAASNKARFDHLLQLMGDQERRVWRWFKIGRGVQSADEAEGGGPREPGAAEPRLPGGDREAGL